jgi:MFS family permease
MDTLGAAVGPLLTIMLLSADLANLRSLYFYAILPGLFSVLIAMTVKETAQRLTPHSKNDNHTWVIADFNDSFKKYLIAWTLFSLANSSDVFLLMKAKNSGFSTTAIVLLYCTYNLTYALSSPYLGKLSDRIPRKHLMIFGLLIFALVYIGFGFSSERWHYWILFFLYGFYMGATDGVGKALAIDYCPKHLKATALGLMGTATGVATIIASTVAGTIWDHLGSSYTFFYGAIGAGIALILLVRLPQKLSI